MKMKMDIIMNPKMNGTVGKEKMNGINQIHQEMEVLMEPSIRPLY